MGIIKKQAIQGTIFSYAGVVLGFITTGVLMPHMLSKDQIGLLGLHISGAIMLAQFASLGVSNAGVRYFTYFRDYERQHNGFLLITITFSLIGFFLSTGVLLALRPLIVEWYGKNSQLFVYYYYLLIPVTFFTLFFGLFDNYAKLLYDSVTGTFLQQFVQRLLIMGAVVVYGLGLVSFPAFLGLWLLSLALPLFLFIAKIARDKALALNRQYIRVDQTMRRQLSRYASLTLLTGLSSQVILHIDKYMVSHYLGLTAAGIYTICSYFGTVIQMPAMALYKVSGVIIADSWKTNDLANIQNIYRKSCLIQLVAGCLVFVGVAANLPSIFKILPAGYEAGYYVILWIGLGKLFDMATGVNGMILATSRYYAYDSAFFIFLVVVTFLTTQYMLPRYGQEGAAIAAAFATALFNSMRTWFVWYKFGLQPFSWRNALVLVIAAGIWALAAAVPNTADTWLTIGIDVLVRSLAISVVFIGIMFTFRIVPDLNQLILTLVNRFWPAITPVDKKQQESR
ncbi:hypothetical protein GCM10023189_43740 [Nibrella saemangeumensis]|uniref:Membrane protein involved in the export of O-antigen and teichoic acid n=1 Tax=Nibrella saemangeumensis TaxID=1084526 RepID=A0ABP8NBA1_9BACT